MSNPFLYIIIQVIVLGGGALTAYFGFVGRITNRLTAIETRCQDRCVAGYPSPELSAQIADIRSAVDRIDEKQEVIWQVLQPHFANIIHSPRAKDRDELVDKFVAGTLEPEERQLLIDLLDAAIADPKWPENKRTAGLFLLARVYATAPKED